jgi:small subunit ribosomal protein S17
MSEDNATDTPAPDAENETAVTDVPSADIASPTDAPEPTTTPATASPQSSVPDAPEATRSARKVREGNVISDKMAKTVVVAVIERIRHPKYGKFMMRTKKLYAHDEANDANIGDKVQVMETRPISKNKRWRVVKVLERVK